jgi:hypothetical protein
MPVSRRLRFEILRRDNHQCRYCGAAAPDVKLTVDHVTPVALGGSDNPSNLVTACDDCNGGKTSIAPDSAIVADVSADALRWADALKQAAAEREAQYASNRATLDYFRKLWGNWGVDGQPFDLPTDFGASVRQLLSAGLTFVDFEELIEVAMTTKTVRGDTAKWKYFCGCCWKRLERAQERARELLDAEPQSGDDNDLWSDKVVEWRWSRAAQEWRAATGQEISACSCLEGSEYCGNATCKIAIAQIVNGVMLSDDGVKSMINAFIPFEDEDKSMSDESLRTRWAQEDAVFAAYQAWKLGVN